MDSVDSSQQTRQLTVPSHSETNLGLLDYETAGDSGKSGLKKSRSNYQKYSPKKQYNTGKHGSERGTAITLRRFKAEFPQLRWSNVRSIRSKYENLKSH